MPNVKIDFFDTQNVPVHFLVPLRFAEAFGYQSQTPKNSPKKRRLCEKPNVCRRKKTFEEMESDPNFDLAGLIMAGHNPCRKNAPVTFFPYSPLRDENGGNCCTFL